MNITLLSLKYTTGVRVLENICYSRIFPSLLETDTWLLTTNFVWVILVINFPAVTTPNDLIDVNGETW